MTALNPARSHILGAIGLALVAVGSYGGGATRYRGGIVENLGLSWITFGHGFGMFEALIWVGLVVFLIAWLLLGRRVCFPGLQGSALLADASRSHRTSTKVSNTVLSPANGMREITRNLIWWLIPLSLSGPLFSRDVYSYLMQGAMLRDGFDPYTEGAAVNPGPMLLEVSADWRNTTTPYGPLHLGLGEVITRIVCDDITLGVILYRVVCIAGFLAIVWSIPRIARALGGNPELAMWLGVLNPLVMLHLIGGLHNEAVMVGLVSLALVAVLSLPRLQGAVVAAVLIGAGVALKATAVIALPFIVWIVVTRKTALDSWGSLFRKIPLVAGIGIALAAIMLATLAAITWLCGSTWGWISEISGNTKVINPLAAPSAVAGVIAYVMKWVNDDVTFNIIVSYTRRVSSVIMLVGLVISWLYFRRSPRHNVMGMIAAYTVACIFNAVALPWYYVSLLTPIGTVRPPRWVISVTIFSTLLLTLSFAGGGNHRFYDAPWMIIITALSWLATTWLMTGRARFTAPWREAAVTNSQLSETATPQSHNMPGTASADESATVK